MARTDWKYDDVVTEKDLNQIGQEINEKETLIGAQTKADTAENNAKAYTDQQITLVTETGIPKLNVYEYKFNNVAIGTTEIEIPLETFDKQTDTVKVYINTVPRDTDYFTVGTNKITLHDPLTVESKVTIEIWKNVPIGEEGSVSGQVIAIDSLPKDRVQGLVDLESEFNSHKADDARHFTTADRTKFAGIQAGAQVNTVASVAGKTGAVTLVKGDVGLGSVENYPIATQAQAQAGSVNTVYMTPLRVKEAIAALPSKPVLDINYTGPLSMGWRQTYDTTFQVVDSHNVLGAVVRQIYGGNISGSTFRTEHLNRVVTLGNIRWTLTAEVSNEEVEGRIGVQVGSGSETLYPVRKRTSGNQAFTETVNIVDSSLPIIVNLYLRRINNNSGTKVAMGSISDTNVIVKIPAN